MESNNQWEILPSRFEIKQVSETYVNSIINQALQNIKENRNNPLQAKIRQKQFNIKPQNQTQNQRQTPHKGKLDSKLLKKYKTLLAEKGRVLIFNL